ncbi:hypothetical protein DPV92_04705 [Haemophilus paraphrohaemolyticus]|uniref:Uncharacterized protein n=1 Tax=Haemophilus paraphrohaemolyticus TaxID=736 RepID=A0A369ZNW4_9PAST|nr:hypothetical protein [Haemophilus paraphrohaemolyticus]RDF10849.1 hypothetical protein DPV92_04705 [Haemophilus paraphrohaemolyticus]
MNEVLSLEHVEVPAYEFEDFYPEHLAKDAAEQHKNSAFSSTLSGLAKVAPLKSLAVKSSKLLNKDEDIELIRSERRLEPFWKIEVKRIINYELVQNYRTNVENPDAKSVLIEDASEEIKVNTPQNMNIQTSYISFNVKEICQRDIIFSSVIDGMERSHVHESLLQAYLKEPKYRSKPLESEVIEPSLLQSGLMQRARQKLLETTIINAPTLDEKTVIECLEIYFRPVFAFEYHHKKDNRTAIIEVDGLTGKVIDNGTSWFSQKANQEKMKSLLKDVVSEVAGSIVPGGATIANMLLDNKK